MTKRAHTDGDVMDDDAERVGGGCGGDGGVRPKIKKLLKLKNSIRFEISAEFYPIFMYGTLKSDKN